MKKCNICGKELSFKDKDKTYRTIIGMQATMTPDKKLSKKIIVFMQKQAGKYKLGKEYNVCWECWLKSMGVKP